MYEIDIEEHLSAMSAVWHQKRQEFGLTLGGLIIQLLELPQDMQMQSLGDPESYRGYYSDLAFEPTSKDDLCLVSDNLTMCKKLVGKTFYGYKGGEYIMGLQTPLWIASYGETGKRLVGITDDGKLVTAPQPDYF